VLGHDIGGRVASSLAYHYPDAEYFLALMVSIAEVPWKARGLLAFVRIG
jgi:pimeloyl-ACP methyl ester carboxylesterase